MIINVNEYIPSGKEYKLLSEFPVNGLLIKGLKPIFTVFNYYNQLSSPTTFSYGLRIRWQDTRRNPVSRMDVPDPGWYNQQDKFNQVELAQFCQQNKIRVDDASKLLFLPPGLKIVLSACAYRGNTLEFRGTNKLNDKNQPIRSFFAWVSLSKLKNVQLEQL